MRPFDARSATRECRALHLGEADERLRELLNDFDAAGVPMEFAFLPRDIAVDEPQRHREAAVAGMRLLARRLDCYFEHLAISQQTPREIYWKLTIDEMPLAGESIPVDEFLGAGLDVAENDRLQVAHRGFVYAFTTSAHPVRNASAHLRTAITEVLDDLTGAVIWQWNDGWSNYFDAGKEWWGTFCWTIEIPRRNRIVFAAASTTD